MRVKLFKHFGIASLSFLIFTGCGMLPYKNDFQCEKGKNGGVCSPVSDVYELSADMDDLRLRTLDEKDEEEIEKQKAQERKELLELAKNDFRTQKLQEMVESYEIRQIKNENPVIFRFFKDTSGEEDYLALFEGETSSSVSVKKPAKSKNKGSKVAKKKSNAGKKAKSNVAKNKKPSKTLVADSNASKDTNSSLENYAKNYIAGLDNNTSSDTAGKDTNASENLDGMLQQAYAQGKASVDCSASGGKRTDINADVKVCVYRANIRKEASCKAEVLRVAKNGEVLHALYEQDGWIRLNDGTYIHKSIVTND